jgi:hypothetical protein
VIPSVNVRVATKSDLTGVLRLYAQPDLDEGKVLDEQAAGRIFERMSSYPEYNLYVAVLNGQAVGTFALLVMDNLGHMGRRQGAWLLQADAVVESQTKRQRAHAFYDSLGFDRHGYSFRVDLP